MKIKLMCITLALVVINCSDNGDGDPPDPDASVKDSAAPDVAAMDSAAADSAAADTYGSDGPAPDAPPSDQGSADQGSADQAAQDQQAATDQGTWDSQPGDFGNPDQCVPGAAWSFSTVDAVTKAGGHLSIGVDAKGMVHLAYYDATNTSLRYAFRKKGAASWNTHLVDNTADVGKYNAMVVDPKGAAYVSYYDATHKAMKVAYFTAGAPYTWSVNTIDISGGADAGRYTSIARDTAGGLHVAYRRSQAGSTATYQVKYGQRGATGGSWSLEVADGKNAGSRGLDTAMVVDTAGAVHLVHGSGSASSKTATLRYLKRSTAGTWSSALVDKTSSTNTGHHSSMGLDTKGGLHVAYHDEGNADLRYATKAKGSASWTLKSVSSSGSVGQHPSLVVDNKGGLHLVYNAAGKLLHTNRFAPGFWATLAVGTATSTAQTGLALDTFGALHIGYQSGSTLTHATLAFCP